MVYLGWHDPNPRIKTVDKLAAAITRYTEKFGAAPAHALVNHSHAADLANAEIEVRTVAHIPPNTFFVGDPE